MTHGEFWELYDNGKLENKKHWMRKDAEAKKIQDCSEITTYSHNGKFYLRISEFKGYYGWWVGRGSNRHWKVNYDAPRRYSVIKEFDNKNSANAYFKKCAVGYEPYDPSQYIN